MEIKISNIKYFAFIMCLFFVSCKSNDRKLDPLKLCSEFYELNKDLNFNGLFNMQILGIRDYAAYNDSTPKYERIPVVIEIHDSISKEYIKLPVFSKNAELEEQKLFFARCDSAHTSYLKSKYKIDSNDDVFKFYIKEIESIYSNYSRIKVPDELAYTNIALLGSDNYIEFILYRNDEKRIRYSCYFVKDTIFSNDKKKDYFKKLPRFDEHWFYKYE